VPHHKLAEAHQQGQALIRHPPLLLPPEAATGVMAVEAVARQTLITTTCGLGWLTISAVASSFLLARQLAQRITHVAQATA
jgi:hypothetical protein